MLAAIAYKPLVRIHLGPLAISPHGIFIAVGFMVGAHYLFKDTRRAGLTASEWTALTLVVTAIAYLGCGRQRARSLAGVSSSDPPV